MRIGEFYNMLIGFFGCIEWYFESRYANNRINQVAVDVIFGTKKAMKFIKQMVEIAITAI